MLLDCTDIQKKTISRLAVSDSSACVLDVGCGDGRKTSYVAQHVKHAVGIDSDETLVRAAKKESGKTNLWFQVAQAESLCFAGSSFDSVLLNESLHHVPAKKQLQALQECQRVLKDGGRLLILEPVHENSPSDKILKMFDDEKECRQSAVKAIESVIGYGFKLLLKERICASFSCNGFDDLCEYYMISESGEKWSENYKQTAKDRLERCKRDSKGDFLIDYYSDVWLLVKK